MPIDPNVLIDLSTEIPSAQGFLIVGPGPLAAAGQFLASAGDVNGDGVDDMLIAGSAYEGAGSRPKVYVVFGQAGVSRANVNLATLTAAQGFVITGADAITSPLRVAAAGDVNGDGIDDVLIGSPQNGSGGVASGAAWVVYGSAAPRRTVDLAALTAQDGIRFGGPSANAEAGTSVASAGDVNGDGIGDIIIGVPRVGAVPGDAYVVFGRAGGFGLASLALSALDSSRHFRITGGDGYDYFGTSVANAGDVNGDGIDDLIVGARTANGTPTAPNGSGAAYIIFGRSSGFSNIDVTDLTATQGFAILGDAQSDDAGMSVSAAGDINGDGIGDFLVGAPRGDDGGSNAGEVYVIFGKAGGRQTIDLTTLAPAEGFIIQGYDQSDAMGFSVSAAGDFNGDGIDDLIVSASNANHVNTNTGIAYLIYGRTTGFGAVDATGRRVFDIDNFQQSDGRIYHGPVISNYGIRTVSRAGDINGDGAEDLIIGASGDSTGGQGAGGAWVLYGSARDTGGGTGTGYDGDPIGGGTLVNTFIPDEQGFGTVAALDGGGFVVLWIGEIKGPDTPPSESPLSDFLKFRVYDADRVAITGEVTIGKVDGGSEGYVPSLTALDGGGFAIVYNLESDARVFVQRFDAVGVAVGARVLVTGNGIGSETSVIVGTPDGGFYVLFEESAVNGNAMLTFRRFDAGGTAVGGPVDVVRAASNYQAAVLADGKLAVAWQQFDNAQTGINIYARVYDPNGSPVTGIFAVDAENGTARDYPSVAGLSGGRFVITWGGANGDVLGRIYDADGGAIGGQFTVNQTTAGSQDYGRVVATRNGGFTVQWSGPDGSDTGTFARHFDADGVALTDEFRTSATIEGRQISGTHGIAELADGDLLFVWEGKGPADDYGVYFRDFAGAPGGGGGLLPALGDEMLVDADSAVPFIAPLAGGGYVVAYAYGAGFAAELELQVFAADGTRIGQPRNLGIFYFDSEEDYPTITGLTGGGFVVGWSTEDQATDVESSVFRHFNADGTPAGPLVTLSDVAGDVHVVAAPDGGFMVIYDTGLGDGDRGVFVAQRYNAQGVATGVPISLPSLDETEPAADFLVNGNFAVASDPIGGPVTVAIYSPAGALIGSAVSVRSGQELSAAALANGDFVVTFDDGDRIYAQLFGSDGAVRGPAFDVSARIGAQQVGTVRALESGGFVVTWQGQDGSGTGLYARMFAANGQPTSAEFVVNQTTAGDQNGDFINVAQLGNNDLVFTWWGAGKDGEGVYTRRFDLPGPPPGGYAPPALDGEVLVAGNGAGLPMVTALAGGGWAITYVTAVAGGSSEEAMSVQTFAADGTPRGAPVSLGSFFITNALDYPSIAALTGGGFAVAWFHDIVAGRMPVVVRRFDADGTPAGPEYQLAADMSSGDPVVVAATDGGYLVIYSDVGRDAPRIQRFDANGAVVGGPTDLPILGGSTPPVATFVSNGTLIIASETVDRTQLQVLAFDAAGVETGRVLISRDGIDLSIAPLANGDAVLTFEDGGRIFAQRLGPGGQLLGSAFRVSDSNDAQAKASVHELAGGGFVVSWESSGRDGSGFGLYARLFDAQGRPASDDFLVNQTTDGPQRGLYDNVEQLANGDLIFTWWGNGSQGSGVYMRRFDLPSGPSNLPSPGNDIVTGTPAGEIIDLSAGGSDTANGGGGSDGFYMGGALDNGDRLIGGAGDDDQVILQGSYAGSRAVTLSARVLDGVETLALQPGNDARFGDSSGALYSYDITLSDANVAPGAVLIVNANRLRVGENVSFNGAAESDGAFRFYMAAGNDVLIGGAGADHFYGRMGADTMTGGGGNDIFFYRSALESTAAARDRITDFTLGDLIDLSFFDANTRNTAGSNDAFTFIGTATFTAAGQLRATSSDGANWLIQGDIDGDGVADLVIAVTTIGNHAITASDFIL